MGEHILSWMTFFPVIGAAVIAFIPSQRKEIIKTVAAAAAAVRLILPLLPALASAWQYVVVPDTDTARALVGLEGMTS